MRSHIFLSIFYTLITVIATSCSGKKGVAEADTIETKVQKESLLPPLQLTADRQQELYMLEQRFAVTVTSVERNSAMEVYVRSQDDLTFDVNYKAAILDNVVRFNAGLEPTKMAAPDYFPSSWMGKGEEGFMWFSYRTDTVFENPEVPAGDLAFQTRNENFRPKAYFEIRYLANGSRDTLKYGYWANFYSDHRLHGKWDFQMDTDDQLRGFTETPFLLIDLSEYKLSGYDGCNRFNGVLHQIGFRLDFTKLAQTKRYCENVPDVLAALREARKYRLEGGQLIFELPMGRELVFAQDM